MANLMILLATATIVGLAVRYIRKQKKQGIKCIGCPSGCNCATCHCCQDAKVSH